MSFFDNTRNVGLAFIIIAVLNILGGIINIVMGATNDGLNNTGKAGVILAAIGMIIAAYLYFKFGSKVRNGEITDKMDILTTYIRIFALATLITGIFSVVMSIATTVVAIIIFLIAMWAYKKITDSKQTLMDKVIWIVLLVIFVLMILSGIFGIITIVGIIGGICNLIIGVFMVILLLDDGVKKSFGM